MKTACSLLSSFFARGIAFPQCVALCGAVLTTLSVAPNAAFASLQSPSHRAAKSNAAANWVTTGNTVAGTTFTQATTPPDAPLSSTPLTPAATPDLERFLLVSPHRDTTADADWQGAVSHFRRGGDTFGFSAVSGYETAMDSTLAWDTVSRENPLLPAHIAPEPGALISVVSLGFMTGVALLRGQKRMTAALFPTSHRR